MVTDPALVHKRLTAEDADELRQFREQFNQAIHEQFEELRQGDTGFSCSRTVEIGWPRDS